LRKWDFFSFFCLMGGDSLDQPLFSFFPRLFHFSKIGVRRAENFLKKNVLLLTLIGFAFHIINQSTRQAAHSLSTLSRNRCPSTMWETCSITLLVCQGFLLLFLCFSQFWDFHWSVAGGCLGDGTRERGAEWRRVGKKKG